MKLFRKWGQLTALAALALALAGCGSDAGSARVADNGNSVENVISEQIAAAETTETKAETENSAADAAETAPEAAPNGQESEAAEQGVAEATNADTGEPETASLESETDDATAVDYDLTEMNSDMVYATVYRMMVLPNSFVGKTVKMSGSFYPYTNEDGTVYYPACIVEDALACCAQGIEFVVTDATYPDDYPDMGSIITVTGTFETYQEGEYTYCHLRDAVLESEG